MIEPRTTERTGLAELRELLRSHPNEGIAGLLDMSVDELEVGRAVFGLTPRRAFANPLGTVHGGVLATLLDSAMSCAVHTTLPAGARYTTLEFKVNFVRPVGLDAGRLSCAGRTVHVGGRTATAEGAITDATGRLIAHGITTCLLFRP